MMTLLIPLNLQLFNSFNHKMIRHLFVGDQIDELSRFVEQNPHLFTEDNTNLSLTDNCKVVIVVTWDTGRTPF